MYNMEMFSKLVSGYNAIAYTHKYIFGYSMSGNVYLTIANSDVLPYVLTLDKASRGAGYALRFCPNKAIKTLLHGNSVLLCSLDYFNAMVSNSKYNRGEIFEKLVTEYFGQTWEKDNVPFTDDGDLTVDGVAYQIKFEKATFCTEASLARLTAVVNARQ